MRIDGRPIALTANYRVTVNSFMASGGDGFTVLLEGRDKVVGMIDVDASEAYFAKHSPMVAPSAGRIRADRLIAGQPTGSSRRRPARSARTASGA